MVISLRGKSAPAKGSVWETLRLNESTAERTLRGGRKARCMEAAGSTMIRDLGDAGYWG
jgi:hypothetical protein